MHENLEVVLGPSRKSRTCRLRQVLEDVAMQLIRSPSEAHERDLFERRVLIEKRLDLAHGDACRSIHGKAKGPGADRRKGDGLEIVSDGQGQAVPVAACQQFVLAVLAVAPDRADGVDDMLRG